ncbi:UNVERIFIED_ORG: 5-methylcytosine-specific restriction endonuclease McrA [Mycolicibacterium obuense]
MTRPSGWPTKGRHSQRKGRKRLPEPLRRRILARYPTCQLAIPGICTRESTQVHHVIDAADGGPDAECLPDGTPQLVGVCKPCHTRVSAQRAQKRSVAAAWDWKRRPEPHPGVLPD